MRVTVHERFLNPFVDEKVRSVFEAGVHCIVARTGYAPVRAHAELLQSSKIDLE